MNIIEYLAEGTYNIGSIIEKIYNDIIKSKVMDFKTGKEKHISTGIVNVTSYFKEFYDKYLPNKKNKKMELVVLSRIKKHQPKQKDMPPSLKAPYTSSYTQLMQPLSGRIKENEKLITYDYGRWQRIEINIDEGILKNQNTVEAKNEIMSSLRHEITHALTAIRTTEKGTDQIPQGGIDYMNHPAELDAYLAEIIEKKNKMGSKYDFIHTMDQYRNKILLKILPTVFTSLYYSADPEEYKLFQETEKKYMKRLAREHLLPRHLKF